MSPLNKRRWENFKKNKRAYFSLFIFCTVFLISIFAEFIANDKESYQYLVESIRKFPDQDTFSDMINNEGFKQVKYRDLTFGIAALHSAWKFR